MKKKITKKKVTGITQLEWPKAFEILKHLNSDILIQYDYDYANSDTRLKPEIRLLFVTLQDAICRAQLPGYGRFGKLAQADAREWILDTSESEWPFTFVNCCEALGLNPDVLRRKIMIQQSKKCIRTKKLAA